MVQQIGGVCSLGTNLESKTIQHLCLQFSKHATSLLSEINHDRNLMLNAKRYWTTHFRVLTF